MGGRSRGSDTSENRRALSRRGGSAEELLHDDDVDPGAVELPLLAVDADGAEAPPLVETLADGVAVERGQDQLVVAEQPGAALELGEEGAADAGAAPLARDV